MNEASGDRGLAAEAGSSTKLGMSRLEEKVLNKHLCAVPLCVTSTDETRQGLSLSFAVCENPTCLLSCGQTMT